MTEIKTKEFGNVVVLSQGEKCPKGIILRETHEGVVLEEYFDNTESKVDIMYVFEERCSLGNKGDFCDCLAEARKYEPDLEVPIYIVATSVSMPEEKGSSESKKAACLRCMVAWNRNHDWSLSPPYEKCDKCMKEKAEKN